MTQNYRAMKLTRRWATKSLWERGLLHHSLVLSPHSHSCVRKDLPTCGCPRDTIRREICSANDLLRILSEFFASELAVPYLVIFSGLVLRNCLTSLLNPQKRVEKRTFFLHIFFQWSEICSYFPIIPREKQSHWEKIWHRGRSCKMDLPIYRAQS